MKTIEERKALKHASYLRRRESALAQAKEYREVNRLKIKEKRDAYHAEHRSEINARQAEYRKKRQVQNPEKHEEILAKTRISHRHWFKRNGKKPDVLAKKRDVLRRLNGYNVPIGAPALSKGEAMDRCMEASRSPEAALARSLTGRSKGCGHKSALAWSLMSPGGQVFQFKNLLAFIRDHQELFTPEQLLPSHRSKNGIAIPRASALAWLSPRRKKCCESIYGWRWHINHEPMSFLADDASPANVLLQKQA